MNNKDVNYYRKMLHRDTIVLFVISLLFSIINFLFMMNQSEDAIFVFLKSILFVAFLIILLCNKKENKTFIGVLAIITGCSMILTSIGDGSLFGIVYLILGIFYVIHSVKYLKNLKSQAKYFVQEEKLKNSIIIYVNLILIFASLIIFVLLALYYEYRLLFSIINLLIMFFVFVSSIILVVKKHKGVLIYIIFVISIFGVLFNGLAVYAEIPQYKNKYTDDNKLQLLKDAESAFGSSVKDLSLYGSLPFPVSDQYSVIIGKDKYEKISDNSIFKQLKEYNCDGYVELFTNVLEYKDCLDSNNSCNKSEMVGDFYAKPYISCKGNFDYITEGFSNEKFEISKDEEQYNLSLVRELEYLFGADVLYYSDFLIEQSNENTSVVINKSKYELDFYMESVFNRDKFNNYDCDGYVILNYNSSTKKYDAIPYLNCEGDYLYKTEGFKEENLKNE